VTYITCQQTAKVSKLQLKKYITNVKPVHKLKQLDSLKSSLCTKVTTNIAVKNICRTREVSFRAQNTTYVRCIRPTSEQAQNQSDWGMTNGASATFLLNLRNKRRAETLMPAQH